MVETTYEETRDSKHCFKPNNQFYSSHFGATESESVQVLIKTLL